VFGQGGSRGLRSDGNGRGKLCVLALEEVSGGYWWGFWRTLGTKQCRRRQRSPAAGAVSLL